MRANAHYTYVHDGEQEYFCAQSISALEARLDAGDFMRVHRSHLVRLSAVGRLKRHGDACVLELEGLLPCNIPVARGQARELKRRLEGVFSGADPPVS